MSHDATLYIAKDMTEPETLSVLGGQIVVFSTRCPNKESSNEDAAAVISKNQLNGILAVADGMGGGASGERASKIAVETIKKHVLQEGQHDLGLRPILLNAIEAANEKIVSLGIGAATTLSAIEIQNASIRPYHIGDSSILVVGQRGKIKLQTIAHSPVAMAVEAGVLDNNEAMTHEDRHLVSNILGTAEMRIEIGPTVQLARYDTVLLATDGLFDNLALEEIAEVIRKGPLMKAIENLVSAVSQRMNNPTDSSPSKPDDLTVIAFRQNACSQRGD